MKVKAERREAFVTHEPINIAMAHGRATAHVIS